MDVDIALLALLFQPPLHIYKFDLATHLTELQNKSTKSAKPVET